MFMGIDLVKDRVTREPAPEEAEFIIHRMKEYHVLISRDGPHCNVLKIKPPLVFNIKDSDLLVEKLEAALSSLADVGLTSNNGTITIDSGRAETLSDVTLTPLTR
jgi:ethanolamine-phosphate phospho-lyase